MGFRNYSPGLNRFTSRDMYNGALADMNLGADPYTGNRYAFGGGNPTSMVELDGHLSVGGAISDIGSALKSGAEALEGALSGTADAAASTTASGGSLLSRLTPWGIAASVFAYASAPTPTASNGYESDPGEKPDYSKGLLLKPDSEKEWQPGDAQRPFDRGDCSRGTSMTYYAPLDQQGRATGAYACLTAGGFNYKDKNGDSVLNGPDTKIMGSNAPWPPSTPGFWDSVPPGFQLGNDPTMNRGHLLARQLGGSGTDRRNLVPLYRNANSPVMSGAEQKIADSIAAGNTVYYSSIPVYENSTNPIPLGVTMTAYTSTGVQIVNQTILNNP